MPIKEALLALVTALLVQVGILAGVNNVIKFYIHAVSSRIW